MKLPSVFVKTLVTRRYPSAWRLAGLTLGALIVIAGAVCWANRFDLLTFMVTHIAERNGLGPEQLIFSRIDLHGLHARDIRLYKGAVQAAEFTLAYSPLQLIAGHVNEVNITGLRVTLVSDGKGFTIGGRPFGASTPSHGAPSVQGFRVDAIKIADAKFVLNGPEPALVAPTRLSGNVAMTDARIDFDFLVETEAVGAKGMIRLNAKGHHDRSSDRGAASIVMAPVVFHEQGAQPVDFFPKMGNTLPAVAGSVALSGSVLWHGVTLSPELVVRLADVSSEFSGVRLGRVDSDIEIVSLWPPATPPGQVLKAIVETGGLPPSDVTLEFQLLPKPIFMAERIQMSFAGGRISTTPFAIDPAIPTIDTVLQFEQVDLSEVLKLIGVDGLSGTGRIDGSIPLHLVQNHVRIDAGRLSASGPGVLHFRSEKLPKEITEAGESVVLALQAMADFHYDSLTLELNESENGEGIILCRLRGNNPAVLDGHPINFNIKFESNFDKLTDIAERSMAAAQELLRRTERSMRQ